MSRAFSPLRGETRPQKRICPPQTCSPHSDLSHPPLEDWCTERVHHFSLVWQLRDTLGFPPLQSVLLPPADHVLGDTIGVSPTAYGPRAGHLSVQWFTLHHPKQGRWGLSFVVEGVTSSRPSRHPKSDMSSSA